MLMKNELEILKKIMDDYDLEITIHELSKELDKDYAQTFKTVKSLLRKKILNSKVIGKSNVLYLDFKKPHKEYVSCELERTEIIIKKQRLMPLYEKINDMDKQFICILFGSHAKGSASDKSDIDLLFIIPKEYNLESFEKDIKKSVGLYDLDLNIITEESLFEMWKTKNKLNVGNEILKNHIIIFGAEQFLKLVRKKYA